MANVETIILVSTRQNMSESGFSLTALSCLRTESLILSLYGEMRVKENPYCGIFYVVERKHNVPARCGEHNNQIHDSKPA